MVVKSTAGRSPSINVHFMENSYQALIDTGSNLSFLNPKIVDNDVRPTHLARLLDITLADGSIVKINNYIPTTVGGLSSANDIECKLHIIENLSSDIILGMNVLKKMGGRVFCSNMDVLYGEKNETFKGIHLKVVDNKNETAENPYKLEIANNLSNYLVRLDLEMPMIYEPFKIKLTSAQIPENRCYGIPALIEKPVLEELQALEDKKIIQRSTALYGSPCFAKAKKEGGVRLLIDCRALNDITKTDRTVFPGVYDELHKFQGSRYFSTLDLQ